MVYMEKQTIKTTWQTGGSWISVMGEGSESDADLYMQTASNGVSLNKSQAFELIELMCGGAGLKVDRTGLDGLIIQKPENPAVAKRRDELAGQFDWGSKFMDCGAPLQQAINYIVNSELEAGVLK